MKKLIGILGVIAIAMTLFFNTNITNSSNGDLALADMLNINTANAECGEPPACYSVCNFSMNYHCILTCESYRITCSNSYPY